MTTYDTVVGVDSAFNFPPEVREAIASSQEIKDMISSMTSGTQSGAEPVGKGEQDVYVEDFLDPNRVVGSTDDRAAFEAARLTGKRVRAREGTFYLSKSPDWSDNAWFEGAGKGRTIIKFLDSAPADATLWGNIKLTGTVQMYFKGFTLDGNCGRQGGTLTAAGGSRSSNMTFRNVTHFTVEDVSSINPLLHSFDVTRGHLDYPYLNDGFMATLRSSNGYFNRVDGTNFGDDGFTVHSSDYIHVANSIFHDPRNRTNCNGLEFDGDSRYCTSTNNRTYNCYGGIEVKGHANESSSQAVTINGHISVMDVRSYHFRHIGHHLGPNTDTGAPGDPVSKSAFDIVATNLVSIFPGNRNGFQDETSPSALTISAFSNVSVTNFTAIGDPSYDFAHNSVVTAMYLSNNIKLSNFNFRDFKGSDQDIYITGGFNKSTRVIIDGVNSKNSSPRIIGVGSLNPAVSIDNVQGVAPATGALYAIDCGYSTEKINIGQNIQVEGFPTVVRFDGTNYSTLAKFLRRAMKSLTGVTKLVDLDVTKDYYFNTTEWATFTDVPLNQGGGNWVEHSVITGNSVIQRVTRNTTGTSQASAWRIIDTSTKGVGAWNSLI
jgi:hypothetical protein